MSIGLYPIVYVRSFWSQVEMDTLKQAAMHQSDTCEPSKVRWRQCMLQIWRPFWCFGMPCCGLLLYSGVARLFFDCVSVRMGEVVASAPSLALMRSWEVRKGLRSAIAAYRDLTFIIHTFGCWVQRLYTQLFALASRNTLCVRSIAHPPLSWQRRSRCRSKNGPLPRFWWPWFLFKLFLGFAGHLFLSIFLAKIVRSMFLWIHQSWGIYTENLPLFFIIVH